LVKVRLRARPNNFSLGLCFLSRRLVSTS
jgi:hypothetical protein